MVFTTYMFVTFMLVITKETNGLLVDRELMMIEVTVIRSLCLYNTSMSWLYYIEFD